MILLGLAAWGALSAARAADSPLAVPADGKPFAAALAACDARWQLRFRTGEAVQTLPAADLVAWGAFRDPTRAPLVLLADGGMLCADVLSADKDRILFDGEACGTVKAPLEALAGVVFRLPGGAERDRLLDRILQASGESDLLLLANGDEISGVFESLKDDVVLFRGEVGELKIETGRIAAIVLNPSLRFPPRRADGTLRAWVGFADGSRLLAEKLILSGEKALLATALGKEIEAPASRIVALQPLGGRAVYLGSLKPEGYRQIPFLDLAWPYMIDRNVAGGFLRCGGRLYLLGIGMHSAARLSYAIPAMAERFEASLGIDDSAGTGGSVRFRVFIDGKDRFTSVPIRGGMPPLPISVEVKDGKRLDLVIDYADKADVLDRADWLDARFVR